MGFPDGSVVKDPPVKQERHGFEPLGQGDLLEKKKATHSSFLAWEISWAEKPGRLQSTGSQRVRHDLVDMTKHKT